ncbi:adenosylcobinamide-phosphate synthase CbiB [Halapricum desulfuricans]|uniref:Probable cobalamin biosynthesis protein CobD n=1 Tax=Halapricum desulfuricans TaxID=2841257 RepID=A0A897N274_9EURY|nr:adenosylcobinamide-phosphate synthase CbiB [Halapricum desulfuricans]QSG06817.1 Cobalamin biosynthesis protein CobD/CbiB [Halapricum desulfuricans]
MSEAAVLAIALASMLDALVGEPPNRFHPVAYLGRLVTPIDRAWSRPRLVGALAAAVIPVLAGSLAWLVVAGALRAGWLAGALAAGLVLFSTTSLRALVEAAREVVEIADADPDRARERIPALVGRDTETLSPGELRSGAVESAAENLADGLVAPLLAFVVGTRFATAFGATPALALGVAAAAWVKGVNTLDSMLGYRSKPVGWASARLDDLVMAVPARVAAVAIAIAARRPGAVPDARSWAREPPSPNSGWPMATLAVALGVRLTKPSVYDLNPGAPVPDRETGARGVRIVAGAGVLSMLAGGVMAWP